MSAMSDFFAEPPVKEKTSIGDMASSHSKKEKTSIGDMSSSHGEKAIMKNRMKPAISKEVSLQPKKSSGFASAAATPSSAESIPKMLSKKVIASPQSKASAVKPKLSAESTNSAQQSKQNAENIPQPMASKGVVPVKSKAKLSGTISPTKKNVSVIPPSNTSSALMQSSKPTLVSKPSAKPVIVKKVKLSKESQICSSSATAPPPPAPVDVPRRERVRPKRQVEKPVKYFAADENLDDTLVGVVVTIFDGSSYDAMFREVKPTTVPGERISTYSISSKDVDQLHELLVTLAPISSLTTMHRLPCIAVEYLHSFLADDSWRRLVKDIQTVPSDSIVFNWECCAGCGDKAFPCCVDTRKSNDASLTMRFMGFALRSGWTVMCSDFSLKSLLHEWSAEELGPNPFMKVGTCNNQFCLEFYPAELQHEEVPQQLQVVGELCADKGQAIVTAMSDTIVYTVNPDRPKTDIYDLKVLTVATNMADSNLSMRNAPKCNVGPMTSPAKSGWAGHVALTYAAGGQLITSMGHWIELSRIDTSLESVIRVAEKNFGSAKAADFREKLSKAASVEDRSRCIQSEAYEMVTKSAPSRMKKRTKF